MISPIFTVTSAFPINVVQATDLNGDSGNNGSSANAGGTILPARIPGSESADKPRVRFRERFRIEFIGEAENLFNSLNAACSTGWMYGCGVNTYNAVDFKRITSATIRDRSSGRKDPVLNARPLFCYCRWRHRLREATAGGGDLG